MTRALVVHRDRRPRGHASLRTGHWPVPAPARSASATPPSGSISSTSTSAPAFIRSRRRSLPGNEGAGVVTAVGEGVTASSVGDRVAYQGQIGAYADERLLHGRPGRADPRGHRRRHGRRHHAQGHDGLLPAVQDLAGASRARPFCGMPPPAASASSPANGPRRSAPASSARPAAPRRSRWPRPMAATRSSITAPKISPSASAN